MKHTSTTFNGEARDRASACRDLAVKADRHAAQTQDPEMRTSFLSMKELWLDLANEIGRRQSENSSDLSESNA